ncbi:MAG TPA: DUF6350 family protein [Micromonosporaceae bacterium]|nr:DUF6350 family protein [Micromonosporaceae bacterium]
MPGTTSDDPPADGRPTPTDDQPTIRLAPGDRATVRLPTQRPTAAGGIRGSGGRAGRSAPVPRPGRRAPLALAAVVTAGWAALVSFGPVLIVVMLAYLADSAQAPIDRVVRLGLAGWLLAHGVPLRTGLGAVGLVPLALTLLVGWRVFRAGVHTTRAIGARRGCNAWAALRVGLAVAVAYGVLGAIVAVAARVPGLTVSVPRAGLTLGLFGLAAGTLGALVETRVLHRLVTALPAPVRDGLRAGGIAALLVLGAGAAVAGIAVALAAGAASRMMAEYHTGVAGQAGLTLVCLVYAPNVAIWAASYLVGPGFVIGTQTSVSAAAVTLGPLPAVPVLAGLPTGPSSVAASVLLVVPLVAGMVAGWLLSRRRLREVGATLPGAASGHSWIGALAAAVLAGPVAGSLLGAVAVAASGPLGDDGLAHIGPRVVPMAVITAAVVAIGAVAAAGAKLVIGVRRVQPK